MTSAKCVACGGSDISHHWDKVGVPQVKCQGCGLVFSFPPPDPALVLSRYSVDWFEKEYLPSYGIDPAAPSLDHLASRYSAELDPVEPFRKTGKLLDVGAGAGLFLSQAKKKGWDVFGVEASEYGPAWAKMNLGIDIFHGTLDRAPFPDNYFDVVMLQDTIEHVPNPAEVVGRIYQLLRVGGALSISTPNLNSIGRRILGKQWGLVSATEHLCLFSPSCLRSLLERSGFEVESFRISHFVNIGLIHEDHTRSTHYRRGIFKRLVRNIPGPIWGKLGMGDELFVIAKKAA